MHFVREDTVKDALMPLKTASLEHQFDFVMTN